MKTFKFFLLVVALICAGISLSAQIPEGLNYQAVLRDNSDNVIPDASITVRFRVNSGSATGALVWEEEHSATTNSIGLFNLIVGTGTRSGGAVANFGDIDWQSANHFLQVSINYESTWHDFPGSQLYAVPYASVANNSVGDFDQQSDNELIEAINLIGLSLEIIEGGISKSVDLSSLKDSPFTMNSDTVTLIDGSLSIGSSNPGGSQVAIISQDDLSEEALFDVKRSDGQTIFAVYNEGVRIYVPTDPLTKGPKGGFAIGGFDRGGKGIITEDYLWVTPDSIRMYIDNTPGVKGPKGGFAIGGFNRTKATVDDFMVVNSDSTRFYIDDTGLKGPKGGFAIGGFNRTKGISQDFMRVTPDSTRVYVANQEKGPKGGFAIGGFNRTKGPAINFLDLTPGNYLIGHRSGTKITTGLYNSFLGYETGLSNTSGTSNALFGYQAGFSNNAGSNNLFLGYQSGYSNTDGSFNSFMGYRSGYQNTSGARNSFLGSYTGLSNTTGNDNTFSGFNSGYSNVGGSSNNFYGTSSGYSNTSGTNNIFIGPESGYYNTTGNYNTFVGYRAGFSNTANNNVFIGNECGFSNTTGNVNVFMGYAAGRSNTVGSGNVFIGNGAGHFNEDGESNVFMGERSGYNNQYGASNVFIGYLSGFSSTWPWANVAIGYQSGYSITQAYNNVFVGSNSGRLTTWGESNVFIGTNAGESNTTGGSNVHIGQGAGENSDADSNVFIGFAAGVETSGDANVFLGNQAAFNNTTGANNVFMGNGAGYFNSTGNGNVFLGNNAGWNESGSNKLYIDNSSTTTPLIYGDFGSNYVTVNGLLNAGGTYLRISNNPGTGATPTYYACQGSIGSSTKSGAFAIRDALWVDGPAWYDSSVSIASILTMSNYINVNKTGQALRVNNVEALWYDGYFSWGYGGNYNYFAKRLTIGHSGGSASYMLYVQGSAYTTGVWAGSDKRFKKDIESIDEPLDLVRKMNGVSYLWKTEEYAEKNFPDGRHYGVIAQEIEEVLPELVNESPDGEKAVAYNEIIPVLIEAIKDQQEIIDKQSQTNKEMQEQMQSLQSQLAEIATLVNQLK